MEEKQETKPKQFQPAIQDRLTQHVSQAIDYLGQLHNNLAQVHQNGISQMQTMHNETMQKIGEAVHSLNSPKRVVRGPDGRIAGVETVMEKNK